MARTPHPQYLERNYSSFGGILASAGKGCLWQTSWFGKQSPALTVLPTERFGGLESRLPSPLKSSSRFLLSVATSGGRKAQTQQPGGTPCGHPIPAVRTPRKHLGAGPHLRLRWAQCLQFKAVTMTTSRQRDEEPAFSRRVWGRGVRGCFPRASEPPGLVSPFEFRLKPGL